MTATIIDGKAFSTLIEQDLQQGVECLKQENKKSPHLILITIGDFEDNLRYVKLKQKRATNIGIESEIIHLPHNTTAEEAKRIIEQYNNDPSVHGILLQLPVPNHLAQEHLEHMIIPTKEVDGLGDYHQIHLTTKKEPYFVPPTPLGCLWLLRHFHPKPLTGEHILVIGRSSLVGRPMAQLMLNANATVTIAHSYTKNLKEIAQNADIIISAAGHPNLLNKSDIKEGATLIDVSITGKENPETGQFKMYGDFASDVQEKAGYLTPVPGGVGPLTITGLLFNVVKSAYLHQGLAMPQSLTKWHNLIPSL